MRDLYEAFEFNLIRDRLSRLAKGERAKKTFAALKMFDSPETLKDELRVLDETMRYERRYRSLAIFPHRDLRPQLETLVKDGVGSADFFYRVSFLLENAAVLKEESSKDDRFPFLMEMLDRLQALPSLKQKIDRIILPDLTISDDASETLRALRDSIRKEKQSQSRLMNELTERYRSILNSERYAMRDSVFVLPVKSSYKNAVSGIIIDESDTGLTVFVEPSEILASENKIARWEEKEKEEERRILKELSVFTLKYADPIRTNMEIIDRLDVLSAKSAYASEISACVCRLVPQRVLHLKNARHPLIDPNRVVGNSFYLDRQKIMVISGPNAGGKTVCLKVLGLLILMHQCGLALPVEEEGELCYFDHLFVDMGDSQSLMDNLSTFSGHIRNLKEIVDRVTPDSIVILDELGTGTSPLEGEALGVGVISYLHEVGCFCILTSHYEGLKSFALENDYILNASMAFDEKEIRPTYHLRLGVAGNSYGLELSQRMGLNPELVAISRNYLQEKKKSDKELTLAALNQKLAENEEIRMQLEKSEREFRLRKDDLEQEIRKYKAMENQIYLDSEKEKEKLIEEAKEKIDTIVEEFKKVESHPLHRIIQAKKDLEGLNESTEEVEHSEVSFQVNDSVRITGSDISGKLIRIKGDQGTLITDQGMNMKISLSQIEKYRPKKKEKRPVLTAYPNGKSVKLECNLIGLRVEEAAEELDKYIDDALVAHYKEVRIVHGSGTGALRTVVHEYLNRRKEVKSYRLGMMGEGGVGATVVYFR